MEYEKTKKYNIDIINQKIMGPNPLKLEEELMKDNKIKKGTCMNYTTKSRVHYSPFFFTQNSHKK